MAMLIEGRRADYDQLDERVRARFCYSCSSSGSEHDGDGAAADAASSCLSGLVHGFFEPPDEPESANRKENSSDDGGNNSDDDARLMEEAVRDLLNPFNKPDHQFRLHLYSQVVKASEALAWLRPSGSGYRRGVMARLRDLGYVAGICKSRWDGSGGLTAGNYEYIDIVIGSTEKDRYIVDLDFAAQFEIARATTEYEKLVSLLPRVMVCRAEETKQVVRIMAGAARRSLKSKNLSIPPWRKSRYMLAKWLGPYRRTIKPLPSSAGVAVAGGGKVCCRTIGFKTAPVATVRFD